jgi:hypothetical protein
MLRSPVSFEGLTICLAGGAGVAPQYSHRARPAQSGILTGARRCYAFSSRNAWLKAGLRYSRRSKMQTTFLTTRYFPARPAPLGIVAVAGTPASVVEHRLKGKWNGNNRDIRRQYIHFLQTSIQGACKLPYGSCLTRVSC